MQGAPASLTLIGYREPFAFVGVKGAAPGSAAVAQDAKKQSKTLLRVEARLRRLPGGAGLAVGGATVGEVKLLDHLAKPGKPSEPGKPGPPEGGGRAGGGAPAKRKTPGGPPGSSGGRGAKRAK